MDANQIKTQVEELVTKLTQDKALMTQFQTEPVKALEKVLGVDLPDEVIQQLITGVKAKLTADQISGAADALKGLFGKK